MQVVIIGAGNVATVFGRLIKKAGHQIIQIISRDAGHAKTLANELGCAFTNDPTMVDMRGDVYLAAISDDALMELHQSFLLGDKLVMHTAGAVSKEILKLVSVNYGVMYPLQSLRKESLELPMEIPLLIDGNSKSILAVIEKFALTISHITGKADDEERLKLHVAAVIVNNFTNHLYTLASDYCDKEGLDFKMLQPLIEETATRLRHHHPGQMQTGPAIRKDSATLNQHLVILSRHPALKKIYNDFTGSIIAREANR